MLTNIITIINTAGTIHYTPECIARLNEINFTWEPLKTKSNLFYKALESYKNVHGNLDIPLEYIVPQESPLYPKKTWGMKIGLKTKNFLYRGGSFSSYREEIESLGLNTSKTSSDRRHWEHIFTGIKAYRTIYGNLKVS